MHKHLHKHPHAGTSITRQRSNDWSINGWKDWLLTILLVSSLFFFLTIAGTWLLNVRMHFPVIHESKRSNLKTLLILRKYYEWLAFVPFSPCPVVCCLVRLSKKKKKKRWTDFSQIWMEHGSWASINHINVGAVLIIVVFCAEIEMLFTTKDAWHKTQKQMLYSKIFHFFKSLNIKEHVWGLQ